MTLFFRKRTSRSGKILRSNVDRDDHVNEIEKRFQVNFNECQKFICWNPPTLSNDFSIGIIIGNSGTGKSILLKDLSDYINNNIIWDRNRTIISHFNNVDDGTDFLIGVGLGSVPTWLKPFHVLSNGEQYRVNLARAIYEKDISNILGIDEFTSIVDRDVARSLCISISKLIKRKKLNKIIFASCHYDILEWIDADWVFDTNFGRMYSGRYLQCKRSDIELEILPCSRSLWVYFKDHHYFSSELSSAARCFMLLFMNKIIGFAASIPLPSGTVKNAWRDHRIVILPEFQGCGFGTRFSDAIAEIHKHEGKRYFSRVSHPKLGLYRDNSPKWRVTTSNNKKVSQHKNMKYVVGDVKRFSHEYIEGDIIED